MLRGVNLQRRMLGLEPVSLDVFIAWLDAPPVSARKGVRRSASAGSRPAVHPLVTHESIAAAATRRGMSIDAVKAALKTLGYEVP